MQAANLNSQSAFRVSVGSISSFFSKPHRIPSRDLQLMALLLSHWVLDCFPSVAVELTLCLCHFDILQA